MCSRALQGYQEGGAARSRGGSFFCGAVSYPEPVSAAPFPHREREINKKI